MRLSGTARRRDPGLKIFLQNLPQTPWQRPASAVLLLQVCCLYHTTMTLLGCRVHPIPPQSGAHSPTEERHNECTSTESLTVQPCSPLGGPMAECLPPQDAEEAEADMSDEQFERIEGALLAEHEDVACAICLSFLCGPQCLPCGHVFCQGCLLHTTALAPDGHNCPACRAPFEVRDIDAAASEALEAQIRVCAPGAVARGDRTATVRPRALAADGGLVPTGGLVFREFQ